MKKILVIISVLIIAITIFALCFFYDEYKMPKDVVLKITDNSFEVYSNKKIKDLIEDSNVEILNNKEELKTNKTGSHIITIEYKYKKRKYKYDAKYKIKDTLKPFILKAPLSYTYYVGEDLIDFCSNTSVIDNYDRNVKCKIKEEIDFNTPGTYNLTYNFIDKSKNTEVQSFTLNIIDPNKEDEDNDDDYYYYEDDDDEDEDYETKTLFSDIVKIHKTKDTMVGLDVSRWQGDIDFKKIKDAGCEFVIIRMAVSNGPDDEIGLDSYFKQNIKNAKKAGLKVGVYVYTAASSKNEIIKQAKFVKKELNKTKLDFPIAYDFESWSDIKELTLNTHDLIDYVDEFYNILHKDGYDVMIYSSKFYLENVWLNEKYPVWLAHYIDKTNYEGDYIMWQMASDGQIDGIDGDVDIDIYYKKR